AEAGGIEDHEGDPAGFNGGDGPGEHGARVAIQEDHAPPFDAVEGKIHLAPINKPVLMWIRCFIGMRLGRLFAALAGDMGDIIVYLLVERHDPSYRAYGNRVAVQQTPDAEATRIGMA